ncbi:MAG: coproporphyrinogen III oxidase [Candidatus Marinimicrobia bacterium CG08_land_8_20_14_0_20_45_22]|nr:MAG: coproporphyrinogen III oxidase [Candidatus Marinimicrobia bacterium CG08_land_8_20_14_0_20_45_22]
MCLENSKSLSIYIHIPFCKRKCPYCAFASEDWGFDRINPYIRALTQEIDFLAEFLKTNPETLSIYIGGGTPNFLKPDHISDLLSAFGKYVRMDSVQEFTIEINPNGIGSGLLSRYREAGINRISIGCQSIHDQELKTLGRIHNSKNIFDVVKSANNCGFSQRSMDFIYGIPGQTVESWSETLQWAISTGVEHISLYNLIFEKGTSFYTMLKKGQIIPLDEEIEWQMYDLAHQMLASAGYVHYEISNWAKPGCQAIHNSVYWNGGKYLGFGVAAHSFNGVKRWWNVSAVNDYLRKISDGNLPVENSESLTEANVLNEYVLLRLRTMDGMNFKDLEESTGMASAEILEKLQDKLKQRDLEKYGRMTDNRLVLNHHGWFICDYIIENVLTIIEEK